MKKSIGDECRDKVMNGSRNNLSGFHDESGFLSKCDGIIGELCMGSNLIWLLC